MAALWNWKRQTDAVKASSDSGFIDGVADQNYDSSIISYYGSDQRHNFLYIKMNRRKNKPGELVLFLQLENECTYELPDHPSTVINDRENSTWSANGLKIRVLQSSRLTRILFNGLLRKNDRRNIDHEPNEDIQHVRLNCIFIASTNPYLQKEYWSPHLLTETLTHNFWSKSKWEQFTRNLNIDECDQYGSMMTEVRFPDLSSRRLYLRGMRQSQWGQCDAVYFDRNICITATDTLGIAFHVRSSNIRGGVKNMQLGHVKNPEENLHPIESLDFDADQLMNRYECGSNDYEFQFSAGQRKYAAVVKLRRETLKILYGGYPWDSQYTYCQFELTLDNTPGVGMIQIWQPYFGSCSINIFITNKPSGWRESRRTCYQKNLSVDDEPPVYILPFDDPRCQVENFVGGKGASLAELTALKATKFTVPKGFCVTTDALDAQIKCDECLMNAIDEFVKVCSGETAGNVKEHSEKMVTAFQNASMALLVRDAIMDSFEKSEPNAERKTYAVRSSAVGEDNEDTSAAGQNSTYLGIESADEVVKYVSHCWASLYTYQSVEYRRQHGLPIKASMGVCVQRMVDAEAAGVMFTSHPTTGNPREIIITANYGLGESVVSALADPDTIMIQRSPKHSLSVESSIIGKKLQKITANKGASGTVQSDVSEEEKSKLSISEEVAVKLAEIGVTLDQLYSAPRDIEWAVSKGQIYLLQCRPVTALDAWTEFELAHELGSGVPSDSEILTLANVGEVLPMVATPLTISTVIHGLNLSTESSYARCRVIDTYKQHIFVVNSKCFLNYATSFLRHASDEISFGSKLAEIAVCGHTINTPEINAMGLRRNGGALTGMDGLKVLGEMIVDFVYKSRMIKEAQRIVDDCKATWTTTTRQSMSSDELHNGMSELTREYAQLSMIHIHATKCTVSFQVFTMLVLAEGNEALSADYFSDIAVLLGSNSDVVSAQVPIALEEITRTIEQSGLSEDFKSIDPSKALPWLQIHCVKAHEQVEKFIDVHGHRGVEEFELSTETWGMRPEKFLSIVQSMPNSAMDNGAKATELNRRELVAQLVTPKKSGTRWLISMLLSSMRSAVSEREHTKCLLIELVHLMRLGYRQLAEVLVREGRLPERELVFFLTHEELAEVVRAPCPNLVRKAAMCRKLRPKMQDYRYKEVSYGMPKPIEIAKVPSSSRGARIHGTSVCNGVATGRACVALNLEEAAAIRPGDILITLATDIGWSPYFPLLAGVVTELGGLISHGAVVAREYGLPCIVSVENATVIFNTGDTITLNGYAGTIEVVEELDSAFFSCDEFSFVDENGDRA